MVTQEEYNASKQRSLDIYARIDLLNFNFQKVDSWENIVVAGTPSFSINSESDIRRTCNISLIPIDKSFDIENGNKIWLDKYIQIYIGIKYRGEIVYTNMGIYLINNPNRVYSGSDNTLSFEGLDLMAKITGIRNGVLEGLPHIIPQNSNVRQVMISTLALCGFTKYSIEECPYAVPNDININIGGTAYEILSQLKNIVPNYQIYFDVNGVFHYEPIPSGSNEQIMVSDDLWSSNLISYQINTDFEDVKNVIEVYGKTHDITNFSTSTTTYTDGYALTIANVDSYKNNLKVGFIIPSVFNNYYSTLNINGLGVKGLRKEGNIDINPFLELQPNTYYVAKYIQNGDYFLFMGEVTPYAIAQDLNPDSPFYINGTTGKLRIVLSGGEYDNIYMSSLAQERANWELYTRCKIQDNITLECVPIYWLDVNWLIEITLPNKQGTEEKIQYITKQINTTFDVNTTQQITAMRYYPFYSEI